LLNVALYALQTHLNKRGGAVADDVTEKNLRELAFDTQRYSGAAIANLVNLAAMRAERDGRDQIAYQDLTDVRPVTVHLVLTHYIHSRCVTQSAWVRGSNKNNALPGLYPLSFVST